MDLRKLDKSLIKKLFIGIIAIIVLFLIIVIIKLIIGSRISYKNIEQKMVVAAKSYYSDDKKKLPKEINGEVKITLSELIKQGYIKDITKLVLDKDATCTGYVTVKNNNGNYFYNSNLDCKDYYKTSKLVDVITKKTVDSGYGLYNINGQYIFRGEKVNNFVSFAGRTWVIIKIDSSKNIKLLEYDTKRDQVVWDDRYNVDVGYNSGINDFHISRIKDSLYSIYNDKKEFNSENKSYIIPQQLCIGKRSEDSEINDGSVECSTIVDNWMLGLLQVNEYITASVDPNCKKVNDNQCNNYNYLYNMDDNYWSITTDTYDADKVYKFAPNPFSTSTSNYAAVKITAIIEKNVNYISGNGSEKKPYIFE